MNAQTYEKALACINTLINLFQKYIHTHTCVFVNMNDSINFNLLFAHTHRARQLCNAHWSVCSIGTQIKNALIKY